MPRTGQGKRMCGWQTIQTVPYAGPVAKPGRENPAAHGRHGCGRGAGAKCRAGR